LFFSYNPQIYSDSPILQQINFSLLASYKVAGMGEPWLNKLEETHVALKECGIGAILTLTEDSLYGDQHLAAGFKLWHEPIDDGEAPTIIAMNRALTFINQAQESNLGVAVHCLEGRGRAGSVLCAWLALKENLGADQAITRVRTLRPHTALSIKQKIFLHEYIS
jgi:atypical dual specificity phosphatase